MELVAHPMGVAFRAVAGVQVVGRCDTHRRRRLFVRSAPPEHCEPWDGTAVILLQPYLPERVHGGEVAEVRRTLGGPHPVQKVIAVHPNLASERFALARVLRQARLVRTEAIAGIP